SCASGPRSGFSSTVSASPTAASPRRASGSFPACGDLERGFQPVEIARAEYEPVARRDVDEIEVDACPRDPARQVGKDAGPFLDLDDDDFALTADREVRDRERVLRGLGVGDEDVQLDVVVR